MSLPVNTIFIAVPTLTIVATYAIVKIIMSHNKPSVNHANQIHKQPNIQTIVIDSDDHDDYHVFPPWSTDLFARRSTGGREQSSCREECAAEE